MSHETVATAIELRKLPLIHGSLRLSSTWERIATEGIWASGKGKALNTLDWDIALGRHDYVFLQPASVHMSYGMGDIILVDPGVVETHGTSCLLHDPAETNGWFHGLTVCLLSGRERLDEVIAHHVRDERLAAVMLKAAARVGLASEDDWPDAMRSALLASDCLPRLYEDQLLDPNTFYKRLADECKTCRVSVSDFVNRQSSSWNFQEEICVPQSVAPRFILGRLTTSRWTPMREQHHNEETSMFFSEWLQQYA